MQTCEHNEQQGFTLVELLIVIVILGILAGIVVISVGRLTDNASNNACKTEADAVRTAIQSYKAQHNGTPPAADTGDPQPENAQGMATTLHGEQLLASATVKYYDGTDDATPALNWSIVDGSVVVSTSCGGS